MSHKSTHQVIDRLHWWEKQYKKAGQEIIGWETYYCPQPYGKPRLKVQPHRKIIVDFT